MRLQRAFARHLRDPQRHPPPGRHEERRLAIYRHAVYANTAGLMQDNFPRLRAIVDDLRWQAMVRDFLANHACRGHAFVDVPLEFLAYLEHERRSDGDPPFLYELAHFDWLETLVGADPQVLNVDAVARGGDLLDAIPVANPTLRLVSYRYPVHVIGPCFMPDVPPPRGTRIAAFRDPQDLYAFLDLNLAAARLLESIVDNCDLSGRALCARLACELGYADLAAFTDAASTILARMHARGALLGTRAPRE